jgi:DNA-cytosine methyltransferase
MRACLPSRKRSLLSRRAAQSLANRPQTQRHSDLWCITAGVPCQDVSVAGRRAGLAGERTGLFYEFARVLRELRPAWFVFENVPGLLSSNGGRDFAEVLRVLMAECGYGVCWRVLDSQFFGVAQRRRRVFIVGRFGKPCPAEVLFERESGSGDSKESREAWADIANSLTEGTGGVGSKGCDDGANLAYGLRESDGHHGRSSPHGDGCDNLVPYNIVGSEQQGQNHAYKSTRTGALQHKGNSASGNEAGTVIVHTLSSASLRESDGHHGRSSPRGDGRDNIVAGPLKASSDHRITAEDAAGNDVIAHTLSSASHDKSHAAGRRREDDFNLAYCLREDPGGIGQGHNTTYAVTGNMRNRSQGAANYVEATLGGRNRGDELDRHGAYVGSSPDPNGVRDFAGLPQGLDSPRYRALGNAVTTQVIQWIVRQMIAYESSRPADISS